MKALLTLLALTLSAAPAAAQSAKVGDIAVEGAFTRATPKGSEVGAGYLTIRNQGGTADMLTGISADFAKVQVHEMKMANGVMQMREATEGLDIPAHGTVKLAPGGFHLMFVGLKKPLVKGESAKITLTFAHAGQISVDLPVVGLGAAPSGAMGGMKGM